MSTLASFEFQVLDTLVNGPSSVAGMYGDLVNLAGHDRIKIIGHLWQALDDLEKKQWAISRAMTTDGKFEEVSEQLKRAQRSRYEGWLPHAERDQLAVDEIGLWYKITESGRRAWSEWSRDHSAASWELDDDAVAKVVTVVAPDRTTAEKVLHQWVLLHPTMQLRARHVVNLCDVHLRSGTILDSAVRVTCSYEKSPGQPDRR